MKKILKVLASAIGLVALSSCAKGAKGVLPNGTFKDFEFKGQGYLENDYFCVKQYVYNVRVDETAEILIETFPNSYAKNSLSFASVNPEVATVDSSGVIKGVKKGVTDILITSSDEKISNKVKVAVSSPSSASGSKATIDEIKAIYADAEHKKPTKIGKLEYSIESYSKEGVEQHCMESCESWGYNAETGYFFIDGPSLYKKTANGHPEVLDGKWTMYPVNYGIKTRLIHETPTAKTFYDLNTASYTSNDRIIRDIINFFFVSGEEIIQDLVDDYDGAKEFSSFDGDSGTSYYDISSDSICLEYKADGFTQEIETKNELDGFEIPAGTRCTGSMVEILVNEKAHTTGMHYSANLKYKKGEENWSRLFTRSEIFYSDFEETKIQNPKENGYTEVDSLSDL